MGNHESLGRSRQPEIEICYPNQFYAAYIFDQAESHQQDIGAIIDEAKSLGCPVRYWWLSQAMDIQSSPDRLIVCVHHPTNDENAGMDLLNILYARQVLFDELDAAAHEEYIFLGRRIANLEDITQPGGLPVFRTRQDNS